MGSVFICIAPKARAQFNEELTCDIELLCQKLCAMGCYSCNDATTFGQHKHMVGTGATQAQWRKYAREGVAPTLLTQYSLLLPLLIN